MSTILKALKKLEQDKQSDQIGGLPADYMGPGSRHARPARGLGRLTTPLVRRSLILLVVLVLGGTSFFFYRQAREARQPTSIPSSTAALEKPAAASESQEATPSAPQTAPAPPERPAVPHAASQNAKAPPELPDPPPDALQATAAQPERHTSKPTTSQSIATKPLSTSREKLPGPGAGIQRKSSTVVRKAPADARPGGMPGQAESTPKTKTFALTKPVPPQWQSLKDLAQPQKIIANRQTPVATPPPTPVTNKQPAEQKPVVSKPVQPTHSVPSRKPAASSEEADDDIAPLTDGRLKVQAIAWSPVVEDRMAVINTRILHEGDKVDGFVVLRIRRDDVVVREKGTSYRVIFGRP